MTIQINKIHLVRYKKLKGGRKAIRNHRVVTDIVRKITRVGDSEVYDIVLTFDTNLGCGRMVGKFDAIAGSIQMDAADFEPKGYTKARDFEICGYTPSVMIANTRPEPQQKTYVLN